MSLSFDIKLNNGEVINKCYFIKFREPIRSGRGNLITYFDSYISCFNKDDKEIKDKDFTNIEILKVYDENNVDVTEYYMTKINEASKIYGEATDWLIRQVINLI